MSKKNERRKESVAYYLVPPETETPRIYHLKLSDEVMDALQANPDSAVVRFGTGKDNALKIGDSTWTLQTKPGSGVTDCVIAKDGYYVTLGKVSQKLTVPPARKLDGKLVSNFKKKNHEVEKSKKSSRAEIKHDTAKPPGKQKRKNAGESIGEESAKKRSKDKDKQDKLAARLSEAELKGRIMHWLALRDMDKGELKRRCGVERIPQGLCKDVAQWDLGAQHYRLLPSVVKELKVEEFADYDEDERRLVRARVKLVSPSVVSIQSDEEAAGQRERYRERHAEYLELDAKLRQYQHDFEALGRKLTAAKDPKQQQHKCKEIKERFTSVKTELMVAHTDFMRLHDELSAIRDALHAFHKAPAPANTDPK